MKECNGERQEELYVIRLFSVSKDREGKMNCLRGVGKWSTKQSKVGDKNQKHEDREEKGGTRRRRVAKDRIRRDEEKRSGKKSVHCSKAGQRVMRSNPA